eukprot:969898-Alexandrium_andersonii.AAC.1
MPGHVGKDPVGAPDGGPARLLRIGAAHVLGIPGRCPTELRTSDRRCEGWGGHRLQSREIVFNIRRPATMEGARPPIANLE